MMEALNRQMMPKLSWGGELPQALLQREDLANGDQLVVLAGGSEAAVLLWVYFPLGEGVEIAQLEASGAFELLLRGTAERSSAAVSERFDALGTQVQSFAGKDYAGLRMLSTTAAFRESLSLMLECLESPLYSPESFEAWRGRTADGLDVAAQTADYVARRGLWEAMLSAPHRYQRSGTPDEVRSLGREAVEEYYRASVSGCRCCVMASGPDDDAWQTTLRELWCQRGSGCSLAVSRAELAAAAGRQSVVKESVQRQQAAVRLGRVLPRAGHAGSIDLQILTSLLGGYMGSRLMQKLREEKGYTYGVRATVSYWLDGGLLQVSSEVGNKYVAECVKDIKGEFARLREELVGIEELQRLRSYLYGQLLRQCDGVYATLGARRAYELDSGYGADYLGRYAQALRTVTPDRLRASACEWLEEESFTLSVAGDTVEISGVRW